MRKISLWLFIIAFVASSSNFARAQDDATQQQIDKLSGQIQDLLAAQDALNKHIETVEKEISDLRDRLNQPDTNNFASADDLKKLAEQMQEIDKKRQSDNEAILKEFEKLEKALNIVSSGREITVPERNATNATSSGGSTQNGYWQTIGSGDTISAIAKAYQDKGIKVTVKQILAANPGLDPKNLKIGQKIWIPAP